MSNDQHKPPLEARWFFAKGEQWAVFPDQDSKRLEQRWTELGGDQLERKVDEVFQQVDSSEKESKPALLRAPPSGADAVQAALAKLLAQKHESNSDNQKQQDEQESTKQKGKQPTNKGNVKVDRCIDPDLPNEHPSRRSKVAVLEDHLFDADVETMTVYPAFFKGSLVRILRATYFYSSLADGSYAPIGYDEPLAQDLETAFQQAKPWTWSQAEQKEREDAPDDSDLSDKGTIELNSMKDRGGTVKFESVTRAKVFSLDLKGKFLSVLGGSQVIRGFPEADRIARAKAAAGMLDNIGSLIPGWPGASPDEVDEEESVKSSQRIEAQRRGDTRGARRGQHKMGASKAPKPVPEDAAGEADEGGGVFGKGLSYATRLWPSNEDSIWLSPVNAIRGLMGQSQEEVEAKGAQDRKDRNTEQALEGEPGKDEKEKEEEKIEEDLKDEPPHLVLAIHGISQALVDKYETIDFVYDVEKLRSTNRKASADPAIRKLARGRRVQFLPVQWRRGLNFDSKPEGNDNFFTLGDVTNTTIPIVREAAYKVVLDVPYYLSSHREKMITAVTSEANRLYRLFCHRNPDFLRRGGQVSIIGHSLGSALTADVLSRQPTLVKPLGEMSTDEVKNATHFLFNVKNTIFIGSPNGFFFHLDGGQLIARAGNPRTEHYDSDASCDAVGKYGCLATEAVYNW